MSPQTVSFSNPGPAARGRAGDVGGGRRRALLSAGVSGGGLWPAPGPLGPSPVPGPRNGATDALGDAGTDADSSSA
ncbi:unnamed protein product [Arctogadus glacialis]